MQKHYFLGITGAGNLPTKKLAPILSELLKWQKLLDKPYECYIAKRKGPFLRSYHYHYPVRLSEQRGWLEVMAHTSTTPTRHYLVARVLLMSDQNHGQPSQTNGQIAGALQINRRTFIRIKKRFVQEK